MEETFVVEVAFRSFGLDRIGGNVELECALGARECGLVDIFDVFDKERGE
tara:strand:- start:258 stop:407 length:150 start_codon:yes stop_codon:yes gene_type:complete